MSVCTRLSLPARKFFIKDLQGATPASNTTSIPNLLVWDVSGQGLYKQFSIVWVQGRITNITKTGADGVEFQLKDSTAEVCIIKPVSVPSGCTSLTQGQYVMVVGELQMSGTLPIIKALKVQDVTDYMAAPGMWDLEVKDMYRYCV